MMSIYDNSHIFQNSIDQIQNGSLKNPLLLKNTNQDKDNIRITAEKAGDHTVYTVQIRIKNRDPQEGKIAASSTTDSKWITLKTTLKDVTNNREALALQVGKVVRAAEQAREDYKALQHGPSTQIKQVKSLTYSIEIKEGQYTIKNSEAKLTDNEIISHKNLAAKRDLRQLDKLKTLAKFEITSKSGSVSNYIKEAKNNYASSPSSKLVSLIDFLNAKSSNNWVATITGPNADINNSEIKTLLANYQEWRQLKMLKTVKSTAEISSKNFSLSTDSKKVDYTKQQVLEELDTLVGEPYKTEENFDNSLLSPISTAEVEHLPEETPPSLSELEELMKGLEQPSILPTKASTIEKPTKIETSLTVEFTAIPAEDLESGNSALSQAVNQLDILLRDENTSGIFKYTSQDLSLNDSNEVVFKNNPPLKSGSKQSSNQLETSYTIQDVITGWINQQRQNLESNIEAVREKLESLDERIEKSIQSGDQSPLEKLNAEKEELYAQVQVSHDNIVLLKGSKYWLEASKSNENQKFRETFLAFLEQRARKDGALALKFHEKNPPNEPTDAIPEATFNILTLEAIDTEIDHLQKFIKPAYLDIFEEIAKTEFSYLENMQAALRSLEDTQSTLKQTKNALTSDQEVTLMSGLAEIIEFSSLLNKLISTATEQNSYKDLKAAYSSLKSYTKEIKEGKSRLEFLSSQEATAGNLELKKFSEEQLKDNIEGWKNQYRIISQNQVQIQNDIFLTLNIFYNKCLLHNYTALHTDWTLKYEEMLKTINYLKLDNKPFMQELENNLKKYSFSANLSDSVIQPVQRPPRHQMLAADIYKKLTIGENPTTSQRFLFHPTQVTDSVISINEAKRKNEEKILPTSQLLEILNNSYLRKLLKKNKLVISDNSKLGIVPHISEGGSKEDTGYRLATKKLVKKVLEQEIRELQKQEFKIRFFESIGHDVTQMKAFFASRIASLQDLSKNLINPEKNGFKAKTKETYKDLKDKTSPVKKEIRNLSEKAQFLAQSSRGTNQIIEEAKILEHSLSISKKEKTSSTAELNKKLMYQLDSLKTSLTEFGKQINSIDGLKNAEEEFSLGDRIKGYYKLLKSFQKLPNSFSKEHGQQLSEIKALLENILQPFKQPFSEYLQKFIEENYTHQNSDSSSVSNFKKEQLNNLEKFSKKLHILTIALPSDERSLEL
ncbi:MAG: hypothetical protein K0S74_976 [Chlamydiales bacterium]|jgi:hypothetical protein|nr:hypothetical protein [Chlamydiales bacterium]